MDRIDAMNAFVRMVESGSFTKAASQLDVPKAMVTRLIQGLEQDLKVRLLHRSTRSFNRSNEVLRTFLWVAGGAKTARRQFATSVQDPPGGQCARKASIGAGCSGATTTPTAERTFGRLISTHRKVRRTKNEGVHS